MKITDFKVVYICPDHNDIYHSRKLHMDKLLTDIGFTNVEHFKSSTEKYPKCLNQATIDILKNNLDNPVLILEDDVEWTEDNEIDFNPEADAIYLGISKSAGHSTENKDEGYSIFKKWSDTQVRVINMLSGHAIFYISRQYKKAIIDLFERHIDTYYNDVLMSRLQPNFLILANKKPIFYQSSKFNTCSHSENWTKFTIDI